MYKDNHDLYCFLFYCFFIALNNNLLITIFLYLYEFSLIRDNSSYSGFTVTTLGADYAVGDRVQVPGGSLDGQSPLNDIDISITAVDGSGGVQTFVPDFIEASAGTEANLISVVTMTEPTSGTIPLDEEITFSALATIEATFTNAHGLVPGSTFITTVSSSDAVY